MTRNADTREILCSEPIPEGVGNEVMCRRLSRAQDIITNLWYEPDRNRSGSRPAAPCLPSDTEEEGDIDPIGGWGSESRGIIRVPASWDGGMKPGRTKQKPHCMMEFACEPDSRLADTVESMGVKSVRVHKGSYDILSEEDMAELAKVIDEHEPDIWGALPCTMWSTWQRG